MPHPDWCGKPCWECEHPCELDKSISCSPGCDFLNPVTGEPDSEKCEGCDAIHPYNED